MSAGDKRHGTPAIRKGRDGRLIAKLTREQERRENERILAFHRAERDRVRAAHGITVPDEAA